MKDNNTILQDALERAQTMHIKASILTTVAEEAQREFQETEKKFRAAVHHIFHTTISKSETVLAAFKSKSLELLSEEPEKEDFLTKAVEAVLVVALDPSKKEFTIELTIDAASLHEGGYLAAVGRKLRQEIGVLLRLDNFGDRYTFTARRA